MEQSVFVYGSSAFVTYKFLFDRKVPEQTVYNNTSKSCKRPWIVTRHPVNRRLKLIAYNSISQGVIDEHKLPGFMELKTIAEAQKDQIKKEKPGKISVILKSILDVEYASWETITDLYKNEFFDEEKLESFCRTHLVISKIAELTEMGYTLKDLYKAYIQYDGLVFETINYHSFCNKIRKIKKSNCLEKELLHKLKNRVSNNPKTAEDIIIDIIDYYLGGKKISASQITAKVNSRLERLNRKLISQKSVERLIGQLSIQNDYMYSRYGAKFTEEHLFPKEKFLPPKSKGALWCIDGTRFQFYYKNEKSKYNTLIYFIVVEGSSREIIGYSYDDSENSVMVLNALEKACQNTRYLPHEIISDNSSAYKQNEFFRKISNMRDWGVIWRHVSKACDNGYAERLFGIIQNCFCRKYDGYLGDGMTSKNFDGKPTQEELKKNLSTKNIRTKPELIALIDEVIADYNTNIKNRKLDEFDIEGETSNRKRVEPIKLNDIMYGTLFWNQEERNLINDTITLTLNGKEFNYVTWSPMVTRDYGGSKVRVRYDINNPSVIMIFDLNSDNFISKIQRYTKIPKAIAERTEEDNKVSYGHSRKEKHLRKRIIKNIEEKKNMAEMNREELPAEIIAIIPAPKTVTEKSEEDYMISELINLAEDEFKAFSVDENESYEELFKNLYKQKGDLKIFNHGKN